MSALLFQFAEASSDIEMPFESVHIDVIQALLREPIQCALTESCSRYKAHIEEGPPETGKRR